MATPPYRLHTPAGDYSIPHKISERCAPVATCRQAVRCVVYEHQTGDVEAEEGDVCW